MKMISNIVFTKNRPLQLHGYLESLYRHFPADLIQTYILWKVELFTEQYEQLFKEFSGCNVIREKDFSSDFFNIINQLETKYILFGIDDVVYFNSVDLEVIDDCFDKFDDILGFSLRHSPENAKECQTVENTLSNNAKIYRMNWKDIKEYPFELCATVYHTELVKKIINSSRSSNRLAEKLFSPDCGLIKVLKKLGLARKVLKKFGYFYSPNTLESWNCRWCQHNADTLSACIYFQKLCASAVQVNMVNVTMRKTFDATVEHTVDALNEYYRQGYRLDIDAVVRNKPSGTHVGKEHFGLTNRGQRS